MTSQNKIKTKNKQTIRKKRTGALGLARLTLSGK
jgi:hypothetical protein